MKFTAIIEVRHGQPHIVCDAVTYMRFMVLCVRDFIAGKMSGHGAAETNRGRNGCSQECEDVCESHGGCDVCGGHVVRCNDGFVAILEG